MKEGGRGVKTAYKDLKSKLKHSSRPEYYSEAKNHDNSFTDGNQESVPSSPVFSNARALRSASVDYHSGELLQHQPGSSTMPSSYAATSTSTSPGHGYPSESTSSSSPVSEMNLLQEIEQHDLFKALVRRVYFHSVRLV